MIAILIQLLMFFTPTISAATLAMKYDEMKRSATSKSWPVVKATISASNVETAGKKYKGVNLYYPEVTLSYEVEGKTYTTKERPKSKDGLTEGPKQWARDLALKYKPGTAVRLYYNPKKPKQATVRPGVTTVNSSKWMVIGGVMLFFSFIIHMLSVQALSSRFLELTTTTSAMFGIVTFIFTLIIGVLIYLLFQATGEKSPA